MSQSFRSSFPQVLQHLKYVYESFSVVSGLHVIMYPAPNLPKQITFIFL